MTTVRDLRGGPTAAPCAHPANNPELAYPYGPFRYDLCLPLHSTATVTLLPTDSGNWLPPTVNGTNIELEQLPPDAANSPRFRLLATTSGTSTITTSVSHPGGQGAGSRIWTLTITTP